MFAEVLARLLKGHSEIFYLKILKLLRFTNFVLCKLLLLKDQIRLVIKILADSTTSTRVEILILRVDRQILLMNSQIDRQELRLGKQVLLVLQVPL